MSFEGKVEFVVYFNGIEYGRYDTEAAAAAVVNSYTGENDIWYEKEIVDS